MADLLLACSKGAMETHARSEYDDHIHALEA
jgi:hypothetical protein